MAKQKISNIAKELNVGLPNIFEFLRKHNIEIVESPNSRVEDSVVAMLTHHFQPDRELKTRSDQQTSDRRQLRADARAQAPARSAEPDLAHTPSDLAQKPRILGKIDLDSKGNPVKPEPKPQPKPAPKQEPKQEPKPAPAPAPEIEKKPEPAPVETQKAEPTPAAKPPASGACSLGACSLLGFTLVAALLLGFLFGARIGVDGRKVDFSEYHRTLHAGRAAGCNPKAIP